MTTDATRLRFAHASLQFSDTSRQQQHDAGVIFSREYDIITGTEAGPGAGDQRQHLRDAAREHGYRLFIPKRPTDAWVAVDRDLIDGGWETSHTPVIPGSGSLQGATRRWGPKGVTAVGFDNDLLGRINVAAAHYLTGARRPGDAAQHGGVNHWAWNRRLGLAVGRWAQEVGKGSALAFYGGDQNMADGRNNEPQGDTFFGAPLTTVWDELGKWPNTGHGNIDVLASYDRDGRVSWVSGRALNDDRLPLHTDHFLVEAVAEVRHLPAR